MNSLSTNLPWEKANSLWASQLNPMLANPLNGIVILKKIVLILGTNVINHGLQRLQQGWIILDINASAVIYRNADFNHITLSLSSSAPVTVNIGVF